jgi:hypothetical protein
MLMPEPMDLVGKGQNVTDSGETRKFEEHVVNFEINEYKKRMEHASASLTPRDLQYSSDQPSWDCADNDLNPEFDYRITFFDTTTICADCFSHRLQVIPSE